MMTDDAKSRQIINDDQKNESVPIAAVPTLMRAVQGNDYGPIDEMITVEDNVPVPKLSDLPKNQQKDHILIRTIAVALAPGDCRVLSGKTRALQGPPTLPYIPGGDCVGIVMEIPNTVTMKKQKNKDVVLKVGDVVGAGFMDGKPRGALGEYSIVNINNVDKVPDNINVIEATALVGASPAITICENYINSGDRVLIFGSSGGIGSLACQVARYVLNASYVVGVTSQPTTNDSMNQACNEIIDYTKEDVFTNEKFIQNKFDIILDFAGFTYQRLESMVASKLPIIIKPASQGGRLATTVLLSGPYIEVKSIFQLLSQYMMPMLGKVITSRTWYRNVLPSYSFANGLLFDGTAITKAFTLASNTNNEQMTKLIHGVIDPTGPFPFTTDGVRSAFKLQESRHARGKVIISIQ